MKDDVRRFIYGTLVVFVVFLAVWLSFVYINACGFTVSCRQGDLPVERTPIPTLIPATLPAVEPAGIDEPITRRCRIAAVDFVGSWASAGAPGTAPFPFTDLSGQSCEADFEEVRPLFVEGNLWYRGSLSCVSCHSVDLSISPAQLDLSSLEGILAGSRREDADSQGTDILGPEWNGSLLEDYLTNVREDVPGHAEMIDGLVIDAGRPVRIPASVETPMPTPTLQAP